MLRRNLVIVIVLAVVGTSFAADADKPRAGSIEGSVADSINAQPLANASITLSPVRRYVSFNADDSASTLATTSDANGRFELEKVPVGEYFLISRKPGFIDRTYGARIRSLGGMPISVHDGETVKGIAVNMLRGAVIAGTVVNEEGEPFANVNIRALQYKHSPQGKRLVVVSSVMTNDHGEYRVHALMPGSYYIAASTPREHAIKEDGKTMTGRYPVTFYPSVATLATAALTPLKAGDEAVVNLTLTAAKGYRVRGKIAGGDPDTKSTLVMAPLLASEEQPLNVVVDEHGVFEIKGLLPGNYRLMAMGTTSKTTSSGKKQITIEDRDLNDVLITLEFARPPEGGHVSLMGRADPTNLMVKLVPSATEDDADDVTMAMAPMAATGSPMVDRYGKFTAAALDHDATKVFATIEPHVAGFEDWYVFRVLSNGQEVTDTGFNPSSGGFLAISYRSDGSSLEGTVIDGNSHAIPGATAVLIPEEARRERRDLYRFVRTDQAGHFTMRGIAPGDYKLLAWEGDMEMEAIYDADFMKPFIALSKTQSVQTTSGAKQTFAIRAISEETDIGAQ